MVPTERQAGERRFVAGPFVISAGAFGHGIIVRPAQGRQGPARKLATYRPFPVCLALSVSLSTFPGQCLIRRGRFRESVLDPAARFLKKRATDRARARREPFQGRFKAGRVNSFRLAPRGFTPEAGRQARARVQIERVIVAHKAALNGPRDQRVSHDVSSCTISHSRRCAVAPACVAMISDT